MKEKYFILIIALTIMVSRLFLWLHPMRSPIIDSFQIHHYMYGVVFLGLYSFTYNEVALAIGLGLLVDELYLLYVYGWNHWPININHVAGYNSENSFLTIALAIVAISLYPLILNRKNRKPKLIKHDKHR